MKAHYKLIIALIALIAGTSSSFAQITLTLSDIALPNTRAIYANYTDTSATGTGIAFPDSGTNKVWNYANLGFDYLDTNIFLDPASTPFAAQYGNSNLCIQQGTNYQFFIKNAPANKLQIVGFAEDTTGMGGGIGGGGGIPGLNFDFSNLKFGSPLDIFSFPASYGSTSSGSTTVDVAKILFDTTITQGSTQINVDSLRVKANISFSARVNGWGTLFLPNNQQVSSLRVENKQTIGVTIEMLTITQLLPGFPPIRLWVPFPVPIDPIETKSVQFFSNARAWSVLEFETDSAGTSVTGARYQYTPPVMGSASQLLAKRLNLYPNPARDFISVVDEEGSALNLTIYGSKGEVVYSANDLKSTDRIELKGLSQGLYNAAISDGKTVVTKKLIVQ